MSYKTGHRVVIDPGINVDLEMLVKQASRESEASSTQDLIDDSHDIPPDEGGLPVASTAVNVVGHSPLDEPEAEMQAKCKIPLGYRYVLAYTMSAGTPSTKHKNLKRGAKRKARAEAVKVLERSIRQKTAMSSTIPSGLFLHTVEVSEDMLTGRKTPPGTYPLTLEEVEVLYSIVQWDGRCASCPYLRVCFCSPRG